MVHGTHNALDEHLDRLYQGAATIGMDTGMSRAELTAALEQTLSANSMHDGVHVRLMLTRDIKKTPSQDPRLTISGPNLVIIAEYKQADPASKERGITLFTSSIRRGSPDYLDPRLNCHSKIHEVQALTQALQAGADEALMLDIHGFVATCNATNFFIVKGSGVSTSTGQYCMNGITRSKVIAACQKHGKLCARIAIPFDEAMLSWTAGPRPEDGVWAPHWYHQVHRSRGFQPYRPKTEPFPSELKPLLAESQPYYDQLLELAIT